METRELEHVGHGSPDSVPAVAWLKILVAFAIALAAVYIVLPNGGGDTPPVRTLVVTASIIGFLTVGALVWAIRTDLGLPLKVALLAAGFNGLVIVVKFVLAPRGLYEVNQTEELSGIFNVNDEFGATVAATIVFCLYLIAFVVLYRLARAGLEAGSPRRRSLPSATTLVILLLVGALLFAVGGALVAAVVIPLIFAAAGLEYLEFVFTSSFALLIGLALAGAAALAALAFGSVASRARLVGDAALIVSFFWLGVAFLALYHALWVVYILILTSTWPLKVVVPK